MHRTIRGLVYAKETERPRSIPVTRPRGAKAQGLRYERALARAVPQAKYGQWFEFRDANGQGYCQTDLILDIGYALAVLEAKYTWTHLGHSQIEQLYKPVVEMALKRPVVGIVVCKVLIDHMGAVPVVADLGEACKLALRGPVVLHWIGKSALGPLPRRDGAGHRVPIGVLDELSVA